jgi:hypothetical protein
MRGTHQSRLPPCLHVLSPAELEPRSEVGKALTIGGWLRWESPKLIHAARTLQTKRLEQPKRKHGNIPL